MQSDNGVYYVSSSTTSGLIRRLDYYGTFTAPVAGNHIVQLTMTLNGHYSASRDQTVYIYNFATGQWESEGTTTIGTTDATVTFALSSGISNYVDAGNHIRVRIQTSALLSGTYTHSNDYFKIDIQYFP
jgi:hypothetical protein